MAISKDLVGLAVTKIIEGIEAQENSSVDEDANKTVKGNKGPTLHYRGSSHGSQGQYEKDNEN